MPESVFANTDYSWLATDPAGHVGWFTINGSGPVPAALGTDPAALDRQETALGEWIRAQGFAFKFGAALTQWHDAASVGIYAFYWDPDLDRYELLGKPDTPTVVAELPISIRQLCVAALTVIFAADPVPASVIAQSSPRR